jgi:uroporphyrinogen-III synthase
VRSTVQLIVACLLGLLLLIPCSSFSPAAVFPKHQSQPASTRLGIQSADSSSSDQPIVVALTREEGKNGKLKTQLIRQLVDSNQANLEIVELPCIAHADGPDYDKLGETLRSQEWDYVAVTSPEAARVLASAWKQVSSSNPPSVAAVGKATEDTLKEFGIPVSFCPSKATAKVLVQEIPAKSAKTKVLYPASAQAATTLQDGLTDRGFAVTRLDTYDTVTATWTPEQQATADSVQIVCVASPSSLKGWLANAPNDDCKTKILAACIGETSAQACRDNGLREDQIFFPEKPGIPGWVDAIQEALQSLSNHPVLGMS